MRWYYGEPSAANERWAFAFSAKKKWREKVKSDVESIISTDRPYVRIFFITNQYAPEKSRSSAEDSLTKLAGIPVTILDRSWILEKVYANNWLELTIRTLNMTGFASLITERIGPRDSARIAELERLDAAVADTTRYGGARYALVEDALESALLARGLERSRHEVEGRFQAAKRIADDVGHIGQRRRIAYNHAWTAFWWFNDPTQFNKLYIEFADLALKSELASDLDDLHALWTLLLPTVVRNKLSAQSAQIKARGDRLRDALGRLASQADRPNNAAQARTTLLTI